MKTSAKFCIGAALLCLAAGGEVVSFKDAAKIKSWDAWGDAGKTPTTWTFKEKRCVTLEKIRRMSSDLEPAGQLEVRPAKAIRSNMWSVGCETMDRDYADWDQYKNLLGTEVASSAGGRRRSRRRANTTSPGSTRRCARWPRWA